MRTLSERVTPVSAGRSRTIDAVLAPGGFERRVSATGSAAIVAVFGVLAALAYWQVFRTDLGTHSGNPRLVAAFADPRRGRILDRDGNVLASSLPSGARHYTDASVAHVLGYLDARFGTQGAELAFNDALS